MRRKPSRTAPPRACWWCTAKRADGRIATFRDLPEYLQPGDCLVVNDSRVFPARLFGHRAGVHALPIGKNNPKIREYLSGAVEVFLLRSVSADGRDWEALVRPGRKLPVGERIRFEEGLEGEIVARGEFGERTVRFHGATDLYAAFERIGHVPLPPYIKRADSAADRERYQTVFAREKGSVAAPTAGLHFTPEVLARCREAGAEQAFVTLHVGLGTFQPLHEEVVEEAKLHTEHYRITRGKRGGDRWRAARGGGGHDERPYTGNRRAHGRTRRARRRFFFTPAWLF